MNGIYYLYKFDFNGNQQNMMIMLMKYLIYAFQLAGMVSLGTKDKQLYVSCN